MQWVQNHSLVDFEDENPPVLWQMAVEVVWQFVDSCKGRLHDPHNGSPIDLRLRPRPDFYESGGLRDQYTVFYFEELSELDRKAHRRNWLRPSDVRGAAHVQTISSLLEGVLLKGKSTYYYPAHSPDYLSEIACWDKSSWEDELCILGDRCAVIYPYTRKSSHQIVFSSTQVSYTDYWDSILRGIEFGLEIRLLAQLAKQLTESYLSDALVLLRGDEGLDKRNLRKFDTRTTNAARLIAHLRTITAPNLIAQANYAVAKFELFMNQTGVPLFLAHAESNLADLTSLLERNHNLYLQIESQRLNEMALIISAIFASLTMLLGILGLPSFIADWIETRADMGGGGLYIYLFYAGMVVAGLLTLLGGFSFFFTILRLLRLRRRNKPQMWQ
ncbi:CorA family divalent cation transporter [Chloroflexi bacterium TSY]|nr:CorA family divalent cation transporter [Chloroflexi bacterium TSY]